MVLKMEQGGLLQHQLPLHADYGLPLEPDCSDHCGSTVQHDAYANGTAMEVMRRDSAINQHVPATFSYAPGQASAGARFVTDRGVREAQHPGSISTSPSSAASSLGYTGYPGAHYTNVQHLPGPVQLAQTFVSSTFSEPRPSSLLDPSAHMLPPPQRHINTLPQPLDRDSFSASSTPYLNRSQLSTPAFSGYPSYTYAETPRSVISSTAALSLSPGTSPYANVHMANNNAAAYGTTSGECDGFPWSDIETVHELRCEGQLLVPKIIARVDKGFFPDNEKRWTCYRRNYFSVTCTFELHPNIPNGRIELHRGNSHAIEHVQATGMKLSAAVDGPDGKNIELIQHTPKRDLGPKTKIGIAKVAPTPTNRIDQGMTSGSVYQLPMPTFHSPGQTTGPFLPLQSTPEADAEAGALQSSQASTTYPYAPQAQAVHNKPDNAHTFERVQFKQATANNGKRRATQQFFHLIVELFADVRKEGSEKPNWVKVAQRVSGKVVVRGRSPSHYQNDKNEPGSLSARPMQSGTAGGYTSMGGASYASLNAGGFRTLPSVYSSAAGVGGPRKGEFYSDHGSQSDSSSSSLDETNVDGNYTNDTLMSDAERITLHEHDGYQYYPGTIYEHVQSTTSLPPLAKLSTDTGYLNDPKMYAVKAEYGDAIPGAQYQASGCNRFQGVDTSRGYFPDLQRY